MHASLPHYLNKELGEEFGRSWNGPPYSLFRNVPCRVENDRQVVMVVRQVWTFSKRGVKHTHVSNINEHRILWVTAGSKHFHMHAFRLQPRQEGGFLRHEGHLNCTVINSNN